MVIPASPLVNQQPHLPQQQQQQPVVENPAAFVKAHLSGGGSAVELAPLKSQLSSTLSHLKTQLTDLINRDYEDFINLASQLNGTDARIITLSSPIHSQLKPAVSQAQAQLNTIISHLQQRLDERRELREKKAFLQTIVNIDDSIVKLEDLLGIQSKNSSEVNSSGAGASGINGSSSGGNNSGDIDSKLIERVAIEFNQLQFLVHSVQGLPFVQGVEWRINRIKDSLTSHLSHALESAYQSRLQQSLSATASSSTTSLTTATASNQYDLSQILRTYVLIDKIREAEAVFGSCCVAPFISKIFAAASPSPASTTAHLSSIYDGIISYISKDSKSILEIASRCFSRAGGGTQADLIVDVIWGGLGCNNSISVASDIGSGKVAATTTTTTGGVADALIRLGSSYWNPGVPEVFHKNYMMTINFLGRLESCLIRCANLSSSSASSTSASNASTETAALYKSKIQLFRGHPLYTEFLKKWQVATYFQIRMRDLVAYATNHPPEVAGAGVATGFSTESASSTDSNTDSSITKLEKTRVLIDHIKTCWSDAVFLPTLAHKFWSLTLQLLARYVVGIRILVPLEDTNAAGGVGSETSSPRSSVVSPDGANAPTAVPMSHSLSTASATSSVSSNVDTSSSSNNSSGSSSMLSSIAISLTALLNTHHDIELVVVKLRKIFEDDVCRLVPRTVDTRVLQATLEHHISSLLSLLPPLRSRVTATLARNCSDSLEVASIPRLFRNTRRPAPTLPSAYVTRILVPLDTGIQQDTAQGAVEDEWMRKVIDEVLVRFIKIVEDTLRKERLLSESLLRLKKKKPGSVSTAIADSSTTELTDEDKIRMQIRLDVELFGKEIEKRGVEASSIVKFLELVSATEKS